MTDAREYTPPRGSKTLDDRLDDFETLLREIRAEQSNVAKELAEGQSQFATMHLRLRGVEIITYGACALGLVAVAGAVISMVVKAQA